MKVLRQGVRPEEKTHQVTCTNCKSELEFQQHEATIHSDQREGDWMEIKCPVCAAKITKGLP